MTSIRLPRLRLRRRLLRLARDRRAFRLAAASVLLLGLLSACAPSIDQREAVHVLTYDGNVDPIMARYIDRGIDEAEETNGRTVVVRLDTPGGLVSSMEDIVKRINTSEVPVIVWVTPSGGHAASAGTFITMAAHVAAMSPGTRIGAASPVGSGGQDLDETLEDKATEDLVALITGIAEERGRNAEWAELAVREAASVNAREAVEMGVVDFEARTLDDLLEQADGMTVEVGEASEPVTLAVLDAPIVENNRTFVERFFALISDPNIAFLLISLGATGLLIELVHPGLMAPGVLGAISLVLGFLALGTLPFNWGAVALVILAFCLFAAEVYVSGFGALGIGGAIALVLGGLLLTDTSDPDYQVNRWLVYGLAGILAVFAFSAMTAMLRMRRAPVYMGPQSMIGKLAVARSPLDPDGIVFLDGARWKAHTEGSAVEEGERVTITDIHGLKLTVRKAEER
jgi:membrane-bound serine protease (ClpP class)